MGKAVPSFRRTTRWWEAARGTQTSERTALTWVRWAAIPLVLLAAIAVFAITAKDLTLPGRWSLFTFGSATIMWCFTRVDQTWVSLIGLITLVASGSTPQTTLHDSLGADTVWLLIGAFVIAAAVQDTGLAARFTHLVVGRAKTVGGVFWAVTLALLPLAIVMPSTTARAAIGLPIHRSLVEQLDDERIGRALSVLIPAVVLTSTIMALTAATSHLIANDLLERHTGRAFSFGDWFALGAPFALASTALTSLVIQHLLLDRATRRRRFRWRPPQLARGGRAQRLATTVVTAVMVGLWTTPHLHGFSIGTVTVFGAVALTAPGVGVLDFKRAMKAVSWPLVIFTGAALAMGQALIEHGVAAWFADALLATAAGGGAGGVFIVGLSAVTLLAHVFIPSHAVRVTIIVPPLLAVAPVIGADSAMVVFTANVGLDYCLSFPVSSKAFLLFCDDGTTSIDPNELLRVSLVALPVHLGLMIAAYFLLWSPMLLSR